MGAETASVESAASPSLLSRRFVAAVNDGSVERATACFAREGCLVTPGDTMVRGRPAIASVIGQLVAVATEIEAEQVGALVTDEVALSYERWTFRSRSNSDHLSRPPVSTLVMRKIEEEWKVEIAAPWGWPQGMLRPE